MKHLLLALCIVAGVLSYAQQTPARPVTPVVPVHVAAPVKDVAPEAGPEETKMARLYRRKMTYLGKDRPNDVLLCGRWTRYYARKVGVEKYMATLMCMWHVESQFANVAGGDGKSFGRAQTCYGYQGDLKAWWAKRGEALGADDEIRTQMAYGVAEFVMKQKDAKGDLWSTVRRYNGCGPDAIAHARKVFAARDRIYGLGSPQEKPAPCPPHARHKKRAKHKK